MTHLSFAQDETSISYQCDNQALRELLHQWEKDYSIAFAFQADIVNEIYVSVNIVEEDLATALDRVFAETLLTYKIISKRYIIITRLEEKELMMQLCGKIIDYNTNQPLEFANVYIKASESGTQTNEKGEFSLVGNWNKAATVEISYLGYHKRSISLERLLSDPCANIRLRPAIEEMPEILVQEFTVDMMAFDEPSGQINFQPEKIPTLPGWGEPDVLRSLQLLPGISASDESASNLSIRGGTSDQNLLLWDGIPVYHAGHFFGLYSAFNPYLVKNVDVYRGGFGAEYGGRVSGVIDISGKPDFIEEANFGAGLNLISAHAYAEIPLIPNESTLLIAGRRSFTDILQSTTYQSLFNSIFQKGRLSQNREEFGDVAEVIVHPDFFYSDFNFKWTWKPNPQEYFALSVYKGNDQFEYLFDAYETFATQDQLQLSNWGMSFNYEKNWNEQWATNATFTSSKYTNAYDFSYTTDKQNIPFDFQFNHTNELQDLSLNLNQEWTINNQNQLTVGLQYTRQPINFRRVERNQSGEEEFGGESYLAKTFSTFFNYRYLLKDKLDIQFGVRGDDFRSLFEGKTELMRTIKWQPRLAVYWYPFDEAFFFKFNVGTYSQFIYQLPISYNDLGVGENLWVLANDYFPEINAEQWSVGFTFQKKRVTLDFEYYKKHLYNLTSWRLELEDGLENPFTQDGASYATGIDVLFKYKHKKYSSWLAYSVGVSEMRFPEINNNVYFPSQHDQLHRLNFTQMLSLKHWDFSISWLCIRFACVVVPAYG
ncbi:MAG: TonB-dependent receptor, partial [Bacteroidota bacterium]